MINNKRLKILSSFFDIAKVLSKLFKINNGCVDALFVLCCDFPTNNLIFDSLFSDDNDLFYTVQR